MGRIRTLAIALLLTTSASTARADITAFVGATTTPANRSVKGLALGAGLLVIGFEFEYAATGDDPVVGAPSLKTGSGNILFQAPVPLFGIQPYFTIGGGVYQEELGTRQDT